MERKPLTKKRAYPFLILLIATIIIGVIGFGILGGPSDIAVAEVRPGPEGSSSFYLEDGEYEVWHYENSPGATVKIKGPGNVTYFTSSMRSGTSTNIGASEGYRRIGTFEADEGNYQVYSNVGPLLYITEPTIILLMTLMFIIFLIATVGYGMYIIPPDKTR